MRVYIDLDVRKMQKKSEAHAYLKEMLDFPEYYGNNLDALFDCLTEMDETEIRLCNKPATCSEYFDKIVLAMEDAEDENPKLTVTWEDSEVDVNAGYYVHGENFGRLTYAMKRAMNGEKLTIGFIGGSITQGARASVEENNYASLCHKWWIDHFPNAEIQMVNAGIGGTGSDFAVARAKQDLLQYNPDVVIVDFSVNDVGDDGIADEKVPETFEGLIRRLLGWVPMLAVIALYNVYYDTGASAEPIHKNICEHYVVPGASMKDTIYADIRNGVFTREYISDDGLHPNDEGHAMVARELCRIFEYARQLAKAEQEAFEVMKDTDSDDLMMPGYNDCMLAMPEPLTQNRYEKSELITTVNGQPILQGFYADPSEKMGVRDCFKHGWIGTKVGDKVVFSLTCGSLAIQYRKTIHKPSPVAKVVVDGVEDKAVILDGNFDQDWGDCLYLQTILHGEESKDHVIEIEIIEATEEDQNPFYLLALITA